MTICYRCKEDKEQLLAVDNPRIGFKDTVCFPCVVECLKDYKKKEAHRLVKEMMEGL